ncbi:MULTISPECIES: hypothetical protein [unclassified Pseudoalteromonas]|uniref:hypothetical protein n=1 Tax=unclassified Pseudoalteromonas TaxID=194690 RepID=UPI000BBE83C2|nr:hypothetical protein [Pseudoalteromonas sp. 1_2015MBL_MicDiv]ATG78143.1 hypothetical protein AOR04_11775 [Pseudoalteromonas sp. 1_2015MBL_MicDiv]
MEQISKVVLFTSSCLSIPTIDMLIQRQLLGAVVLVPTQTNNMQSEIGQLQAHCTSQNIQFSVWNNDDTLLAQLDDWQVSMALSCFNAGTQSQTIIDFFHGNAYGIYPAKLSDYQGTDPLYWQIREHQDNLLLTVYRLSCEHPLQFSLQQSIAIHPFDTYQSLAIRVASAIPQVLSIFFEQFDNLHWQSDTDIEQIKVATALNYDNLTLSFEQYSAVDLVAAARAGNPLYGGFILSGKFGDFNVLQASFVDQASFTEPAGTVLSIDKSQGLVVQTKQGSVALDIVSCQFGCISGYRFASLANITAGMQL